VPNVVTDTMRDYVVNHNANTLWIYESSLETDGILMMVQLEMAYFPNPKPDD
jgi:hypothetical protein